MSWRAIIVGDLSFPEGGVARWRDTAALAIDYDWPEMIAQGLGEAFHEHGEDEEPLTVGALLGMDPFVAGAFRATELEGEDVRLRYVVDGSLYASVADQVVRFLCAAAHVGASGRVLFCDGDAAVGSGVLSGALVTLRGGEMKPEAKKEKLSVKDKEKVDALVARMLAEGKSA